MNKFILGTKGETKQQFNEQGERIAVTQISTASCHLVSIKSPERDGYWAIVLGFCPSKKTQKSRQGLLSKAGIKTPLRFLREVRINNDGIEHIEKEGKKGIKCGEYEVFIGDEVKPSMMFQKDDQVSITGTSIGKGFQGVMKRHGFHGGPKTHGQSDRERAPGSIGTSNTPGRVMKGKKMAGRMGGDRVTIQKLKVVSGSDTELYIKGLVPGRKGGLLVVRS